MTGRIQTLSYYNEYRYTFNNLDLPCHFLNNLKQILMLLLYEMKILCTGRKYIQSSHIFVTQLLSKNFLAFEKTERSRSA